MCVLYFYLIDKIKEHKKYKQIKNICSNAAILSFISKNIPTINFGCKVNIKNQNSKKKLKSK